MTGWYDTATGDRPELSSYTAELFALDGCREEAVSEDGARQFARAPYTLWFGRVDKGASPS